MDKCEYFQLGVLVFALVIGGLVVYGFLSESAIIANTSSTQSGIVTSYYESTYQGNDLWVYTVNSNGQILQVLSYCNAIQINSIQLIVQYNNQKWHFTGNLPYGCS